MKRIMLFIACMTLFGLCNAPIGYRITVNLGQLQQDTFYLVVPNLNGTVNVLIDNYVINITKDIIDISMNFADSRAGAIIYTLSLLNVIPSTARSSSTSSTAACPRRPPAP